MAEHQQNKNGSKAPSAGRFAALYLSLNAATILLFLLMLFSDRLPFPLLAVCPLHEAGLYCPTCGMTRALRALLRLDPLGALRYNPCVFFLLVTVAYYEAVGLMAVIRRQGEPRGVRRWPLALLLLTLLVFFIVRNVLLLGFSLDPTGDFL